jgi:hypothetical protein
MKNKMTEFLIYSLGMSEEKANEIAEEFSERTYDQSDFEDEYQCRFDEIDRCYIHEDRALYCEREEITTHEDNTFYCDYSEEYFTSSNYSPEEIIGDCGNYISNYWRRLSHSELNRRFGLYYNSNGEFCTEDEYYAEQEIEESEPEYNFSYHGSSPWNLSNGEKAKIGFEIEKEDIKAKQSIYAEELQINTGWGKESDSSLDSYSGFELVSPIFPLHESIDYFNSEFLQVEELINANYSKACGGHVNYSNTNYTQNELLNEISGWIPLIYSLYEHRIGNTYCKAKSPNQLSIDNEKYQAIRIKSNCLEFRIFPAVKNVKNLLWRLRLIQIMDLNKTSSAKEVIRFMTDENHDLFKLLNEIFSLEGIIKKVNRVAYFSSNYEGEIISQDTINQFTKHIQSKIK